ncbi:MAG: Bax inhibitor-1/YccA family protein, partial [Flavobacteriales bacterium]
LTAVIAYFFSQSSALMSILVGEGGMTIMGYIVMFAPLILVLVMSFQFNKISSASLLGLFILYSAIMGVSLSFIFLTFTGSSIASTFGVTSITFGIMAVTGYTTNTDLTKFGSILYMGLIGIIVASLINLFLGSAMLEYIISFIGVLIFTGLTAYDTQKMKQIAQMGNQGETTNKMAVMGALSLYLDFVNLFLFLLHFLGDR